LKYAEDSAADGAGCGTLTCLGTGVQRKLPFLGSILHQNADLTVGKAQILELPDRPLSRSAIAEQADNRRAPADRL
jgi:hypothetical protein